MSKVSVVDQTAAYMQQKFADEGSGHDWWHIYRVLQLSRTIAAEEADVNMELVELAALLHDIADWKFNDNEGAGGVAAAAWLKKLDVDSKVIDEIVYIVDNISFKGGTNERLMRSLEGKIVQDADRLDAMGAIGIGRTFAFGGARNRLMYDPKVKPKTYKNLEEFKAQINDNHTINHFYEKLLKLKDGMHTRAGRRLAEHRHVYMEKFLEEFYAEWEGQQ